MRLSKCWRFGTQTILSLKSSLDCCASANRKESVLLLIKIAERDPDGFDCLSPAGTGDLVKCAFQERVDLRLCFISIFVKKLLTKMPNVVNGRLLSE